MLIVHSCKLIVHIETLIKTSLSTLIQNRDFKLLWLMSQQMKALSLQSCTVNNDIRVDSVVKKMGID